MSGGRDGRKIKCGPSRKNGLLGAVVVAYRGPAILPVPFFPPFFMHDFSGEAAMLSPLVLDTAQGPLSFPRVRSSTSLRVLNFSFGVPVRFPYGVVLDACGPKHVEMLALAKKSQVIPDRGFSTVLINFELSEAIRSALTALWALYTVYDDTPFSSSANLEIPFDICLVPANLLAILKNDAYFADLLQQMPFRGVCLCDPVANIVDDTHFCL